MGLYLAVFQGDRERDGVEVGSYSDFNSFRDQVVNQLEGGKAGTRFPILIMHSDCDGVWTADECTQLHHELVTIQAEFRKLLPLPLPSGWQSEVARSLGLRPTNLDDCFFDVDGELLTDRLIGLVRMAEECGAPIIFQ